MLTKLKNGEGVWVDKGPELDNLIYNYFRDLFKSSHVNVNLITNCIQRRIPLEQSEKLTRSVVGSEVKEALFEMKPDKSPGHDGMTPAFFQHHCDVLDNEVTKFCDSFVQSGIFPIVCNRTQIVMIPKKSKPEFMGDLRQISLCNIIYKTAAKVLANHLKPIMCELISESQNAFVLGRLISDNIMVAYEIHNYLKRKNQCKVGLMAAKLDMSIAFDRVELNLLWQSWIKWVSLSSGLI